ncbi:MAG: hypothetical protein Tsb0013_06070 [Phycisphaerales bacterium]
MDMVRVTAWCAAGLVVLAGTAVSPAQVVQQEDVKVEQATPVVLDGVRLALVLDEQRIDGTTVYRLPVDRQLPPGAMAQRWIVSPTYLVQLADGANVNDLVARTGHRIGKVSTILGRTFVQITAPTGAEAVQSVASLADNDDVVVAQNVRVGHTVRKGETEPEPEPDFIPDEPDFNRHWHLFNDGSLAGTVAGEDANVRDAWEQGITGMGVTVFICDDGIQSTHPDIAPKYVPEGSFDGALNVPNPGPKLPEEWHGTACAGIAAGAADGENAVGVAYNAGVSGFRFNFDTSGQLEYQEAHGYRNDINDVHSNSYGPPDTGFDTETLLVSREATIENAIATGRGGLGTIFVVAGGNGGIFDDANYDGFASSRYTISVTSSGADGSNVEYNEPGAAHLINAPSDGAGPAVFTSDVEGLFVGNGYTPGSFVTDDFGGTSASCPIVAGTVALMLEANPSLTWRDVQRVLVDTADQNDRTNPMWQINAAGRPTHPMLGFGRVNAGDAVRLADVWFNLNPEIEEFYDSPQVRDPLPLDVNGMDDFAYNIAFVVEDSSIEEIEHVEFSIELIHEFQGEVAYSIQSPSGTVSLINFIPPAPGTMDPPIIPRAGDFGGGYNRTFASNEFLGEDPNGVWIVTVLDTVPGNSGVINDMMFTLYGTTTRPLVSDCDEDGQEDVYEIAFDPALDCNGDGEIDDCQITADPMLDLDANGELDSCQIADDPSLDCNLDGVLDSINIAQSLFFDCNGNDVLDTCEIAESPMLDANNNGFFDSCEPGLVVDTDGAQQTVEFTTFFGGNTFGSYCGTVADGEDYAVVVSISTPTRLTATLDSTLGVNSVVAIKDDLDPFSDCLAINDSGVTPKATSADNLLPGTYYVIVDSTSGAGDFSLQLDFESLITTCQGDFDGDGDIDLGDFGAFAAAFESVQGDPNYTFIFDFNFDGDIDLGDFGAFGVLFNGNCPE